MSSSRACSAARRSSSRLRRAASAPRDCAARCRCPSTAHRPARRRPCPCQSASASALAARVEQHASRPSAPRRARARGASRDRRPRSVSRRAACPRFSIAAASASVLPPAPAHRSITVSPGRAADAPRRRAGCRSPGPRSARRDTRPIARPAVPDGRRRPCGVGSRLARDRQRQRRAIGLERVDADVERRALEQRRGLGARDARGRQPRFEPARARRRRRRPASPGTIGAGPCPSRRTAPRAPDRPRPAAASPRARSPAPAAGADRAIDQLAHRAAVVRLPAKRRARNHSATIRSAGAPLARAAAMTWSSNSIAAWTRAAGVIDRPANGPRSRGHGDGCLRRSRRECGHAQPEAPPRKS